MHRGGSGELELFYTPGNEGITYFTLCSYKNNGGCSEFAICNDTELTERTCTCKPNYIGDGFKCRGNIFQVKCCTFAVSCFSSHSYLTQWLKCAIFFLDKFVPQNLKLSQSKKPGIGRGCCKMTLTAKTNNQRNPSGQSL